MNIEKQIEMIQDKDDKLMLKKISENFDNRIKGHTKIQIQKFVLNDIEFPTDYGKFQQCKSELYSRFKLIIESYYQIKEKEIEIKKMEEQIKNEPNNFEKDLLEIKIEKENVQLKNEKNRVLTLLGEMRIYYDIFMSYSQFHNLTEEEEFNLELEQWNQKSKNMPLIFEERYGEKFLSEIWGEDVYKEFAKLRQKTHGLLPREFFDAIKLLKEHKNNGRLQSKSF